MRALALLLAACAVLAGCGSNAAPPGGAADPPSEGRIMADAVRALARLGEPSVRYRLEARVEPRLSEDAGPFARLAEEAVELELQGGFSPGTVVAAGKVRVLGEEHEGELRSGEDALYLRLDDGWYGGPTDSFETRVDEPARGETERLARALEAAGDDLVDGEASAGPEIDGAATWQIEGTPNPDTAAAIARAAGGSLPAAARDAGRSALEGARLMFAAGREDHLPRRVELRVPLGREVLALLGDEVPLERLDLEIDVALSDWGRRVAFERPDGARPFEELLGRFLLGFGTDVELDGARPPIPVPGPPPQVALPPPAPPG